MGKTLLDENRGRTVFWKRIWRDYGEMLYMVPVLLGILCFTLIPMITSLNYAFHDYRPNSRDEQLVNFGLQNFKRIFTKGEDGGTLESVMYALWVTFRYSILNIIIGIVGSYMLALFLNQKTKGIKIFRVVYYLPVLIPGLAGTLLWKDITASYQAGGYLNTIFVAIGLPEYSFYRSPDTVLPTLLLMSLFSLGGSCIMWLAQMKNVPTEMYESAELDGANYFHKLFFITIPMTTSMLFYMLVMSTIGGLQAFGNVYPLKDVAGKEVEFIVVQIYESAYVGHDLSYACALSWVLFVIIGILTAFVFKTSKWVYYGEDA